MAHRVLAIYAPDFKESMRQLEAANAATEEHQWSVIDRHEELARLLRVQALRASEADLHSVTRAREVMVSHAADALESPLPQMAGEVDQPIAAPPITPPPSGSPTAHQ